MAKILFVSENQVKTDSLIEINVDSKTLSTLIFTVQNLKVADVLGRKLYAELLAAVKDLINDEVELTDLHQALLEDYVQPYLISAVKVEFIILNSFKLTNKGMMKLRDDNADMASVSELEHVRNYHESTMNSYKDRLIDFLFENKLISRADHTDTDTTSDSTGWFLY